jgi:hypothetical protein
MRTPRNTIGIRQRIAELDRLLSALETHRRLLRAGFSDDPFGCYRRDGAAPADRALQLPRLFGAAEPAE